MIKFMLAHPYIPDDCHYIIHKYLPFYILERCDICAYSLILQDKKNRLHFNPIVCTEAYKLCEKCYEENLKSNNDDM